MSRYENDKGRRAERQFARITGGLRVPLSGAMGGAYSGDVIALGLRWECKVRNQGFLRIYKWLEGNDAVAIKCDRKPWLAVLPIETLLILLDRETTA